MDAVALAESFKEAVASLPSAKYVTLDNKTQIETIRDAVNAMTAYEQGFLDTDSLTKLKELLERIAELEKLAEENQGSTDESEAPGETENGDTSGGEGNE